MAAEAVSVCNNHSGTMNRGLCIEIPTANLAFSTMTSSVKVSIGLCDCDNNGEPETGGLAPLCYVNILACPKSLRSVLSSSP